MKEPILHEGLDFYGVLSLDFPFSVRKRDRESAMSSSSKKPKEENKKKKDKSNRTAPKETKKPEKKATTPQKSNKPKPKPDNKRKRKEKIEENGGVEGEEATVCRFPMNRIKRIIKSEDSRLAISQDVVFLVNKATEMFLEKFSEDGYKCSVKDRKKSLSYKHLATVAHERKRYDFLSDYVPQKIKAEDALKEMNSTETGEG